MPRTAKKPEEKQTKETKSASKVTEVTVFSGRKPIRTYSLEIHGEDFIALAEQFASKYGYTKGN